MRSTRRPSFDPRSRRQRPKAVASAQVSMEQLERRFAKFRRKHAPQTRIPDSLRGAVLTAMGQGITVAQLRRCCGLSSTQLDQWQRSHGEVSAPAGLAAQDARVFSVVGDVSGEGHEMTDPDQEQQLELRLDGWSICVRRVGR